MNYIDFLKIKLLSKGKKASLDYSRVSTVLFPIRRDYVQFVQMVWFVLRTHPLLRPREGPCRMSTAKAHDVYAP